MTKTLDTSGWKDYIQSLGQMREALASGAPLGKVITDLKKLLAEYSVSCPDELTDIDNSYTLMRDFMLKGYKDDHRRELYAKLSRKLFRLMSDMRLSMRLRFDAPVAYFAKLPNTQQLNTDDLRSHLESFVSDMALLSLEGDDDTSSRHKALYEQRQTDLSRAFVAIVKSGQWSSDRERDMCSLVLSPTIDTVDAQVLCSAIMMSALLEPDSRKVSALVRIYEGSTDEHLRQRAFVGWVMALNACDMTFAADVKTSVAKLLDDETVRAQLMELQMQMVYCMGAERDNEAIQKDVMPTIIKNQNFEITRFGIKEKEEDPMDDILHGDEADSRVEEMENSIRKMMDMQKQGVDIYFGGFSKMKRFAFFHTVCNWFTPFYTQHPDLAHISKEMLQSGFIKTLFDNGPFCDSDKYSFAYGVSTVYEQLPANIKEMILNGAAMQINGGNGGATASPVYIRRLYLQDLYRFFRVCDSRKAFCDPFASNDGWLFMDNGIYVPTLHDEAIRTVRFLLKRHQTAEAKRMLEIYFDDTKFADLLLMAYFMTQERNYVKAKELYEIVYSQAPDDPQVLKGYAVSAFHCQQYDVAAKLYERLSELFPANDTYKLNEAVSLINAGREDEGVKVLYELYYTSPDNNDVRRALAWGQLCTRHLDKAAKLYEGLLEGGEASDYLNAGYCAWFGGDLQKASRLFGEYSRMDGGKEPLIKRFREDTKLFDKYGIDATDRCVMAGL